jgi:hypothetical protein
MITRQKYLFMSGEAMFKAMMKWRARQPVGLRMTKSLSSSPGAWPSGEIILGMASMVTKVGFCFTTERSR